MLSYKEVHLLIEQGVNSLGIFTEQALLHEQIDMAINHVVEKHIRDLKDTPSRQYSMVEKSILEYLTVRSNASISFTGEYYEADLPADFGQLSSSYTVFALCNCKGKECLDVYDNTRCVDCGEVVRAMRKGDYYVAKSVVKYNEEIYAPKTIFEGVNDAGLPIGEYVYLPTRKKANISVTIDSLDSYSVSALIKNSFKPLLAYDRNKFYIYYKPIVKNKELPLQLVINYTRAYSDAMKISWCDEQTLGFPSDVQRYYIDLAIAYIAVINKQEQQNVVNLKQETI